MKVVVRTSTYPHHLDGPPRFIMFPVLRMPFDPNPVTPHSTGIRESCHRPVHRCLTFSYSEEDDDDTSADEIPSPDTMPPVQYHLDAFQQTSSKYTLNMYIALEEEQEEEENFPTVLLDGEHMDMEEIP